MTARKKKAKGRIPVSKSNVSSEKRVAMVVDEEAALSCRKDDSKIGGGLKVFDHRSNSIAKDEELVLGDKSAYNILLRAQTPWPCLSLDVIRDHLGINRTTGPHLCYFVGGTQADQSKKNSLHVIKSWNMNMKYENKDLEGGSSESSDTDTDSENECFPSGGVDQSHQENDNFKSGKFPQFRSVSVSHPFGSVNRIGVNPICRDATCSNLPVLCGVQCDDSKVRVFDLRCALDEVDQNNSTHENRHPILTMSKHSIEGYALAWSPQGTGQLLTGDCNGQSYLWRPVEGGWDTSVFLDISSRTQGSNCKGGSLISTGISKNESTSIEDISIHPYRDEVVSMCSTDGYLRVLDSRQPSRSALDIHAHDVDVNVLSYNPVNADLIVTGGDDGCFKVWDLKMANTHPVARFTWHKSPITSVSWHPIDESVLCVSSEDNSVSLWDLSVESSHGEVRIGISETGSCDNPQNKVLLGDEFPPQLMFLHLGQKEVREIKMHPQIPGLVLSTASDSINIFKACNI